QLMPRSRPRSPLFPYTTLFRSSAHIRLEAHVGGDHVHLAAAVGDDRVHADRVVVTEGLAYRVDRGQADLGGVERVDPEVRRPARDRKSTRLNSSHLGRSYAVFC